MPDYRIVVKTGGAQNAGTDANVYITLIGAKGNRHNGCQLMELKKDLPSLQTWVMLRKR